APTRYRWQLPTTVAALAAAILIAVVIWPRNSQAEPAINLSRYVEEFRTDPAVAQQTLLRQYNGKSIQPDDAIAFVGNKALSPQKLPDGSVRKQMYLIETPHCKCVQSMYVRPDGGSIAVFEHVGDQPAGFGKRPMTHANCDNKDVSLVQCDGQIAASWKHGD